MEGLVDIFYSRMSFKQNINLIGLVAHLNKDAHARSYRHQKLWLLLVRKNIGNAHNIVNLPCFLTSINLVRRNDITVKELLYGLSPSINLKHN